MIRKIDVTNFQSHRNTVLELDPGVNVIVGMSDSGKSGFIRATKAAIFKSPFYTSFGTKEGSVEVAFDDLTVKREFSATVLKKCPECKENLTVDQQVCHSCGTYLSDKTSTDRYVFDGTERIEKFGVRLPEQYLNRIRMFPMFFVDFEENLNLTNQHDDMFFIGQSYSGNVRNKILSSLIPDSSRIDVTVKALNARYYSLKSENEFISDSLKRGKDTADKIRPLYDELVAYRAECLSCCDLIMKEESRQARMTELKAMMGKLNVVLRQSDRVRKLDAAISKVESKNVSMQEKELRKIALTTFRLSISNLGNRLLKIGLLKEPVIPSTEEASKVVDKQQRLLFIRDNMKDVVDYIKTRSTETGGIDTRIRELREEMLKTACPITEEEFCKSCKEKLGGCK